MSAKDSMAKEYFADNARFADLCNNILYGGRAVSYTHLREGMMMMDDCILQYYNQGLIAPETAVAYAHDPVSMASRVHLYY